MSGVLHALATAATREVKVGGVEWRLRRASSADLARAQSGALALLPVDVGGGKGKALKKPPGGEALAKMADLSEAMVCAAVTHARMPGADWEAVTLVTQRERADATKDRLWVGDLTMATRQTLFAEAMAHSTEDGEATARLEAFRTGT
jgi:hypothetical protein